MKNAFVLWLAGEILVLLLGIEHRPQAVKAESQPWDHQEIPKKQLNQKKFLQFHFTFLFFYYILVKLHVVDFILNSTHVLAQSCPTLYDSMDCTLSGSSVRRIFQARILKWVAISYSINSTYTMIKCLQQCMSIHPLSKLPPPTHTHRHTHT